MKSTIEKIRLFANQKPGLDFMDYGERKAYLSEMREITKDLHDFRELMSVAVGRVENLDSKITNYLQNNSGRLTLNESGNLEYCSGQYFPTEYRPAVNRVLANLIFADYRDEKDNEGNPVYNTGNEIRAAIKRRGVSLRVLKNYFN